MAKNRTDSDGGDPGVKTLAKTLRVLETLAERQPLGVTDLAQVLAIPKSRASRFLNSLEGEGYAARLNDGRFVLGSKLVTLSGPATLGQVLKHQDGLKG